MSTWDRRGFLQGALSGVTLAGLTSATTARAADTPNRFDVKSMGAAGDGKTLDTTAIDKAIAAASAAGGGTV